MTNSIRATPPAQTTTPPRGPKKASKPPGAVEAQAEIIRGSDLPKELALIVTSYLREPGLQIPRSYSLGGRDFTGRLSLRPFELYSYFWSQTEFFLRPRGSPQPLIHARVKLLRPNNSVVFEADQDPATLPRAGELTIRPPGTGAGSRYEVGTSVAWMLEAVDLFEAVAVAREPQAPRVTAGSASLP